MKKNNFIRFLICVLCVLFLTACCCGFSFRRNNISDVKTRSYVLAFGEAASFQMQLTDNNNIILYWSSESIRWFPFERTRPTRYDEFVERYNDLGYYRVISLSPTCPLPPPWYISNRIVSIDVRSDTDFNAEHPAGTSLAGFVRLLSVSPMRFIESGYQETFNWHNNYPADFLRETDEFHRHLPYLLGHPSHQNHFPISELLSKLEPDDFRLLGTGASFPLPSRGRGWFLGFLVFDKEPDNPGTHNLTITIHRSGQGQVLSQTIEKTFGN